MTLTHKFRTAVEAPGLVATGDTTLTTATVATLTVSSALLWAALVLATITMADVTGAATDGALSLQLKDLGNSNITSARRVMIVANATEYGPHSPSSTVTFSAATVGSIVDSGAGWAVIDTSAAGAFSCTVSNSADETVYLRAVPPEVSSSGSKYVAACQGDATAVAWSA